MSNHPKADRQFTEVFDRRYPIFCVVDRDHKKVNFNISDTDELLMGRFNQSGLNGAVQEVLR